LPSRTHCRQRSTGTMAGCPSWRTPNIFRWRSALGRSTISTLQPTPSGPTEVTRYARVGSVGSFPAWLSLFAEDGSNGVTSLILLAKLVLQFAWAVTPLSVAESPR